MKEDTENLIPASSFNYYLELYDEYRNRDEQHSSFKAYDRKLTEIEKQYNLD